jgi:purine-binding chemotaxis protein CheW
MSGTPAAIAEPTRKPTKFVPSGSSRVACVASVASSLMLLRLGTRWFAIDVSAIEEVSLKGEVTRVPTAPSHILGVTSLRGRLLTVVGLAQMLGGEVALCCEGAATLPRLVVVRSGDFEMAIVAETIGGMIDRACPMDPERPSCSFVREEFDWQGNRVSLLDVPALIAAAAKLAGIHSPTDREES